MEAIVNRLSLYLEIAAPVDNGRPLVTEKLTIKEWEIGKSRLETNLQNLEILFDEDCTYKDAINAWSKFFNHSYWNELYSSTVKKVIVSKAYDFDDTEEFIWKYVSHLWTIWCNNWL